MPPRRVVGLAGDSRSGRSLCGSVFAPAVHADYVEGGTTRVPGLLVTHVNRLVDPTDARWTRTETYYRSVINASVVVDDPTVDTLVVSGPLTPEFCDWIRSLGGKVVHVVRPVSERCSPDIVVMNDCTPAELATRTLDAMRSLESVEAS